MTRVDFAPDRANARNSDPPSNGARQGATLAKGRREGRLGGGRNLAIRPLQGCRQTAAAKET